MSIEDASKEVRQPLGLYDIFGYLLPGFFLYSILIVDFDGSKILRYYLNHKNSLKGIDTAHLGFKLEYFLNFIYYDNSNGFGLIPFIIFSIFCYLTGHLMASFSSFIVIQIVENMINNPTSNLFSEKPLKWSECKGFKNRFFYITRFLLGWSVSNYRKPFKESFISQFKIQVEKKLGYTVDQSDYYWLTYAYICSNSPTLVRRIQHFVNLSGFARNVTGTFIFYLFFRVFFLGVYVGCSIDKSVTVILICYVITVLIMSWTYLKLQKRQALDMFYIFYTIKS